jgi:tetratricopeptide (TPR) repeat protein
LAAPQAHHEVAESDPRRTGPPIAHVPELNTLGDFYAATFESRLLTGGVAAPQQKLPLHDCRSTRSIRSEGDTMTDEASPNGQATDVTPAEAVLKRGSEVVSGIAAFSTLLVSLSSDSLSTTWLLWVATGLCGACFLVVFALKRPVRGTKSFSTFIVAFGGSALLLGAAWAFAFRDEIRFSKAVTGFSNAPSVLVDPRISRSVLPSRATGSPPQRLASYVDSLVMQRHRTRICSPTDCPDQDLLLVVSGTLMDSRFAFDVSIPGLRTSPTKEPNPRGLAEVLAELDAPGTFLSTGLEGPSSVIRIAGPSETAQVAIQAAYHLASAVRSLAGPDTKTADEHVKQFLSLSRVLSDQTSREWMLQGVLVAAVYYQRCGDLKGALDVVRAGLKSFPEEERLAVAEGYLRMEADRKEDTADVTPVSSPRDPPPGDSLASLQGVFWARAGMFWEASGLFSRAAVSNRRQADARARFHLHLGAALLAALSSGSPTVRGQRTVDNAEQAIRLYSSALLPRLLEAFGHALKESSGRSDELFDAAHRNATLAPDIALSNYWRARAYAETDQLEKANHLLESTNSSQRADASALGLFAEVLVRRQQAEAGLKRAQLVLNEDPTEVKSNRLLGLNAASDAAQIGNSQRQTVAKAALKHLSAAVRSGGEDQETYFALSDVYRTLGRASEARYSSRKALEFACSPGGQDLACRVVAIRNLLESNKPDEATVSTNAMLELLQETRQRGDELLRSSILVQAAIAWYEHKGLDEAEILYRNVIKDLNDSASSSASQAVLSQVNCNIGFVYIDRGRNAEALRAFHDALMVQRQPDCEAGMAVALKLAGRRNEALAEYERARNADPTYETDIDMLKRTNFWSDTACRHLRWLAAEYKKSQGPRNAPRRETPT